VHHNPSTGHFSRRVQEKNKKENKHIKEEALCFTYLARRFLTADFYEFWCTCSSRGAKFYRNRLMGLDFVGGVEF